MAIEDTVRGFVRVQPRASADGPVTAREFIEAQQRLERTVASIINALQIDLVAGPALTGDVTSPANSSETTIAPGVVTLAKMANIATDRLVGRDTAGTGVPEALTVGGGVEFTGSGGIQRAALTGDVTATAGSGATTIAANAVSNTKLRDSAAVSVIGRSANSTGDPADIAAAADEDILCRRGSLAGFYGVTAFEAYRGAGTLTITTGTGSVVTFDTEVGDADGAGSAWFVHTTGIATIPRNGWYIFTGTGTVPNIDDDERAKLVVQVDGSDYADGGSHYSPGANNTIAAHVTAIAKLTAGQTVNLLLVHNEGSNQTASVGVNFCRFSGAQLR